MGTDAAMLVVGDINVDVMARLDEALIPGGESLPKQFEMQLGGVAANVAVALAKWGVPVRLAGCVGRDAFGDAALAALERQGVDTTAVSRADVPTGLVFIPVEPGGQRTIIGSRGASQQAPVMRPADCVEGVRGVHLVGHSLLAEATAEWARELVSVAAKRSIPVSLDVGQEPARVVGAQVMELAARLDVLMVGQQEAEALGGVAGILLALNRRHADEGPAVEQGRRDGGDTFGARLVILKQGAAGCQFFQGGRWWKMAPLEVQAVDTTGAGDAFATGYWVGRLRGWQTGDAVALANACGAAAATVLGAGEAMPGPEEVMRVLEQQPAGGRETSAAARLLRLLRAEARPARAV